MDVEWVDGAYDVALSYLICTREKPLLNFEWYERGRLNDILGFSTTPDAPLDYYTHDLLEPACQDCYDAAVGGLNIATCQWPTYLKVPVKKKHLAPEHRQLIDGGLMITPEIYRDLNNRAVARDWLPYVDFTRGSAVYITDVCTGVLRNPYGHETDDETVRQVLHGMLSIVNRIAEEYDGIFLMTTGGHREMSISS